MEVRDGKVTTLVDDFCVDVREFSEIISKYDCIRITEDNYAADPTMVVFTPVENLHDLSPNYLRRVV